jgi:hypothetical protein
MSQNDVRLSPELIAQLNKLASRLTHMGEYNAVDLIDTVVARVSAMPQRELLREALEAFDAISGTSSKRCPFTRGTPNNLQPEDPCPVCGDKGDFSDETTSALSRCVGNAPSAIARTAADKIRAALTQEKQT